ncbi:two-component sensor histidine kinase [Nostoc sp. NIES-3756]|uniref:scytonemin biosynthesis sensor histidine kinase n=1 Tax=Nostoc sp. NIES-3756 TaxID=1751286 RepID=UPI00071EAFC1|nr:scytonemin biosynthesis sensor histidine kinase [Nostoc sp. NIES-3756]BAT52861.1 two-component sensor histidine kinase [Nostoc sp. NIES-3756]
MTTQSKLEFKFAHFLINNIVESAFCLGEGWQFLYVNDATCRMTEYSREELLTMSLPDVDIDFSLRNWSEIQLQDSCTFKTRYRAKSGRSFLVETSLTFIEEQGKKFSCAFVREKSNEIVDLSIEKWLNELRDANNNLQQQVAELKKKEVNLETSLSVLSSTLESTAIGIVSINVEGDILNYNQKFAEMWKIPQHIILSKKCPRCKAFFESQIKDPETFNRMIWEVSSTSNMESYDVLELKDGRVFAHYSQPQSLGEKIIGRVWSIWDITKTRQTEEALRLNEARFRALAETSDASTFLIQGTQFCYVNPAVEVLTGYSREELLNGFDIRRLIKHRKGRQIRNSPRATNFEYQEITILTKNGAERWLACALTVLDSTIDFQGKSVEMITAIDITDYKQAETELNQALEQAKHLGELRASFLSMVCHQFRNPLNIVSFSNNLLKRYLDAQTEETVQPILDQVQLSIEQLNQMLDDMLFFARTEAAKLKVEASQFELVEFCNDLVAQMQMGNFPNLIHFASQEYYLTVWMDKNILNSILKNLLDNAVKYSPSGSMVELKLFRNNEKVVFQIKDSGIGISLLDQQRLFEPFYRGNNVDNIPGTGLGLSIVKTLVDLHSGQITVESKIGVGTKFTVMLPYRI